MINTCPSLTEARHGISGTRHQKERESINCDMSPRRVRVSVSTGNIEVHTHTNQREGFDYGR